ncbi:MAG: hypothetical protein CPSOU_4168 [uncultured Paraburkholderia sp.]|nr:MAG: hypothetical protein CPSOU_4168 [uncultured Paraburkholderia sp.]
MPPVSVRGAPAIVALKRAILPARAKKIPTRGRANPAPVDRPINAFEKRRAIPSVRLS